MYAVTDVSTIPSYPLEPDEETGNPMFRINHYHGIITYLKDDFLTPHRKNYYRMFSSPTRFIIPPLIRCI
jgi:hypothetical protein